MVKRLKCFITGVVQGVGFRPFVYRLASELNLKGFVLNSESGVILEVEGEKEKLEEFLLRIQKEKPPVAKIFSMESKFLEPIGYRDFKIEKSKKENEVSVAVLPDLSTCQDCLKELFDRTDRRFRYPFINCTNCGPRFTIIESLPYDRKNTTMKEFNMCPECLKEYENPLDRRFHAQPNACPACGPWLYFIDKTGKKIAEKEEAFRLTVEMIKEGEIVAVKGLGGFHLICDATNEKAVRELRRRKHREEKPFAVMFKDILHVRRYAYISPLEERALTSVESPIVILNKKPNTDLAPSVSPENSTVGAFLPYTPLHHLLTAELNFPIVATSCNLTDEPIAKDDKDLENLIGKVADGVLSHNRKIARRCDDSVVRVFAGAQIPIRRSRGFAPLPILLPFKLNRKVLATGPFMKNTVAVAKENKVFLSQHIGDIDNPKAEEFFKETVFDMLNLFEVEPDIVVVDAHPGYYPTKFAIETFGKRVKKVFHHHAHIVACMAENEVKLGEKVIGIAFDGTGYGTDGTIWGGEFLLASYTKFLRLYHLKQFRLPGGDKAVKEPYRVAVSLLTEAGIPPETALEGIDGKKLTFIEQMLTKGINAPLSSSMGRLFDGVAAILGIRQFVSYHAQAAILLEQLATKSNDQNKYPFSYDGKAIDWREMIKSICSERGREPIEVVAKRFHNTIAEIVVSTARKLAKETGHRKVALSGGVFQNRLLTEMVVEKLKDNNLTPLIHQIVPPNDGGLSLGQAVFGGLIEEEN